MGQRRVLALTARIKELQAVVDRCAADMNDKFKRYADAQAKHAEAEADYRNVRTELDWFIIDTEEEELKP